ncbi:MAG: hypothetical protein QOJ82_3984, partial [Solirubrobacteraceae bacterium]|nr:hypothetical protein [Solirubrobacteraceae bacterium]
FREETVEDRARRERLRAEAARRSFERRQQRVVRHSTARFVMLVLAIIGTTVLVTVVMFQMLALWFAEEKRAVRHGRSRELPQTGLGQLAAPYSSGVLRRSSAASTS